MASIENNCSFVVTSIIRGTAQPRTSYAIDFNWALRNLNPHVWLMQLRCAKQNNGREVTEVKTNNCVQKWQQEQYVVVGERLVDVYLEACMFLLFCI